MHPAMTPQDLRERRAKARRSALLLGAVALLIAIGSMVLKALQS